MFQQGVAAHAEISALVTISALGKERDLSRQILRAAASIPAQVAEGFGQKSDRHFAHFLFMARGSCNEVRAHLLAARDRHLISPSEHDRISAMYVSEGKMLTRLIQHLVSSDRKLRA